MKALLRGFAFLAVSLILGGCNDGALPPGASYASLSGTVIDSATNQPIAGAIVTLDTVLTATSDAAGHFTFAKIPTGDYDYTVQVPGYQTLASSGSATPGRPNAIVVRLAVKPTALSPGRATPASPPPDRSSR